jgi:hypothetical protein
VRAVARPGSDVAWISETADPILGLARASHGRVAQFASSPRGDWAPLFGRDGGAAFGDVIRWLSRGTAERVPGPKVSWVADVLRLEGLAPSTPLRVDARLAPLAAEAIGVGDGREEELGVTLELPRRVASRDALRVREARLSGSLRERAARGGMALFLDPVSLEDDGDGESWAPIPAAAAAEFDLSTAAASRVPRGSGDARIRAARPAAHRLAVWILASGLVGLFLAAVLGRFRGPSPVAWRDRR